MMNKVECGGQDGLLSVIVLLYSWIEKHLPLSDFLYFCIFVTLVGFRSPYEKYNIRMSLNFIHIRKTFCNTYLIQ